MLRTLNRSRNSARENRWEVECDSLLRELECGGMRLKQLAAEIAGLRRNTLAAPARGKTS